LLHLSLAIAMVQNKKIRCHWCLQWSKKLKQLDPGWQVKSPHTVYLHTVYFLLILCTVDDNIVVDKVQYTNFRSGNPKKQTALGKFFQPKEKTRNDGTRVLVRLHETPVM
jgi:hypothetical protein